MYPLFTAMLLSGFCLLVGKINYLNVLFLCLFAVQAHNSSALIAQNLIAQWTGSYRGHWRWNSNS